MTIKNYIESINQSYKLGNATEHTFRGYLKQLIENLAPKVRATNEPKRQSCGAPDYVITKKEIPIGYIEAKDIGKDLNGKEYKEQFGRYKKALENLIITDYIWFQFFQNGKLVDEIRIGEIENDVVKPIVENFQKFENLIKEFCTYIGQTIKLPKTLAEMMAGKARLLSDVIEKALTSDEDNQEDSTLKEQMTAFERILIQNIKPKEFADVYAQTIAYGMFAARLHDPTLGTFSRQEAAELIPKSNPFLRKLFGYIAGPDIDDRIKWIVDNLAEIFLACDVEEILANYGKEKATEDPIIHFYETFLAEYDPKLRKARGVWYTPAPVVNFIVRAVDDILKTEFDLPQGLADTSKTKRKVENKQEKEIEKEFHKIQILDPATGTGTFLAEIIKQIHKKFEGQEGIWSSYVENDLLPRLNGFELLMASYAMAHLQLDLLLKKTGFEPTKEQRTRVFLTNSLEEAHTKLESSFADWLNKEANKATLIKRDTPVMCIIGNPPYSGESANKSEWIMKLMDDYKKEPGGTIKLQERNPKWINDDYVKFLRYGQHFIEKNGSGILAFINPHGFLDNPTFRGMRWNLLKTYDKIYTIDLHGNSKKKEVCPDGSIDQNVFDIMQGVSINIFVKTGKKKSNELGKVFHYDLYGKREYKYDFLEANSLKTVKYKELPNIAPHYFMVPKDFSSQKKYQKGFSLTELFPLYSVGIVTGKDSLYINQNKNTLREKIKNHYGEMKEKLIRKISYRPFDNRYLYNNIKLLERNRFRVMQHFIEGENVGLVFKLGNAEENSVSAMISKNIIDFRSWSRPGMQGGDYITPLYKYPETTNGQQSTEEERIPNLNKELVKKLAKNLGLTFTNEKETSKNTFAPLDILDYIYAVLHSPNYREKYKEFLKTDFPRVPHPKDKTTFWQLVTLGAEIRQIHLLESAKVEEYITSYPKEGNNKITTKIAQKNWQLTNKEKERGKIWINETQYFDNIPLVAWEFYIGGYQPAQKWLKDRKEKTLKFDDILHYQKIIAALSETDRLMKEIDKIEIE